ncbi:MAG: hypothetical protein LBF42_02915 [Puniceicoccales bacterium]|jgi:hypothetical protein|nr:hypothetical protein [Puniceicoccales bacterium]
MEARPDFKDLVFGEGCRSSFVALGKLVKGIEDISARPGNECNDFLGNEIAQNAAKNRNFDLLTLFKKDLLSQLDSGYCDTIENLAKRHPEEFKAFAILAALWCHHGISDLSCYFSPQLPPNINPVVQGLTQMIRDGNIAPQA